jgi:hypothetical protein
MQPIAIAAVAIGIVMIMGVSATLAMTRRRISPGPRGVNRWHLHGSIPLAAAGLTLGVISRGSGQTPATHHVLFTVTSVLLLGAFLCAVAGATSATGGRPGSNRA